MSTQPGPSRRPSPLPVLLTRLVGREREVAELRDLLLDPAHRLVTVTGPGGIGKTRLALDIAEGLRDEFDDDVAFVQLSAVQHGRHVLPAIGRAFGLLADIGSGHADPLLDLLRGRRVLLILDNCEQIPDIYDPVRRLLAACPDATILATSQAPIGIAGEQLYPLSALTTPPAGDADPEEVRRSDAVTLFLDRARAVNPHLDVDATNAATIAEICRYLEGLPLAIELAAARSNILSPAALLARLSHRLDVLGGERRDLPERLRTMRRAIAWSYDLLAPEEQRLFRHLSVFGEAFSLDAVETVHDPGITDRAAIDILATLVDRSLVRRLTVSTQAERYLMLRTLRDYGVEQLQALGEESLARLAHARVMMELAEEAEPYLLRQEQQAWLDRLDEDRANIRAAIEWSLANGHEEIVFRIGGAIWRFFSARGLITEARAWLDKALAAQGNHLTQYRTRALVAAGYLAEDQRDLDVSERLYTQARHLAAAIGDTVNECQALIGLGTLAQDRSDYDRAQVLHHEALAMARAIGDTRSVAVTLANLGGVSYYLGRPDDAIRNWEESRAHFVEAGDRMAESVSLMNIGVAHFELGQYAKAEKYYLRALDLQRQLNLRRDLAFTLNNLAEIAMMLGDVTLAHDAIAEAISLYREIGSTELLGVAYNTRGRISMHEGNDIEAATCVLESLEHLKETGNLVPIIENGELMAELCSAREMHAMAVELMGATQAVRERIGANMFDRRRETLQAVADAARNALGETAGTSVIDLTPGEWLVLDVAGMTRSSLAFTVTGEMPADLAEPESNVTLEMGEMYFEITDGAFVAGENVVHLYNAGAQPHFAEIMQVPDGTENANVEAVITQEMGGTPEAEPLNFEEVMPVAYLAEQSEGVSSWAPVTLEAGTYMLLCFVTDPETGMPHAMMGMHDVFVVE